MAIKDNNDIVKEGFLERLALYFYRRPRQTALIALVIAGFGIASYATILKREGFPSIDIPYAIAQGVYFDDAAQVDAKVAKPVSEYLLKQESVKSVQTSTVSNFTTIFVQYEDGTNAESRTKQLESGLQKSGVLTDRAELQFEAAKFGFTDRGDDAVLSFISTKNPKANEDALLAPAEEAVSYLQAKNLSLVKNISLISPFDEATDPATGTVRNVQSSFERYGERLNDKTTFFSSIPIGATLKENGDLLDFEDQLVTAVDEYNSLNTNQGYQLRLSASFGQSIRQQISELQKTLIEGLIAVLIVGSIVIAVRASFITVISMVFVILATLGFLQLIGYTLNTITLFSLILGLALIVDDTIIMVEAIDAQRKRKKDANEIVRTAVRKVGLAMIAATSTAALSFAPLLFVGGILGEFIRAIPVTIISALLISLLVALVFIPFFARFLMLGKKHIGKKAEHQMASDFEDKVANFLALPMMWAQHSYKKLALVSMGALLVSALFVGGAAVIGRGVAFNIFPPSKDTNQLVVSLSYPPNTDIKTASTTADEVYDRLHNLLGADLERAGNYAQADSQSAQLSITLRDYSKRGPTAPEYIRLIEKEFASYDGARVTARTIDAGPPASNFMARVLSDENQAGAQRLAADIAGFIESADIRRPDDSKIAIKEVSVDNPSVLTRNNSDAYVGVTATFIDTDTTALVTLTQSAVEKTFTSEKIKTYGLQSSDLVFDFGQESANQESFQTLLYAFPAVLLVIYIVLAVQFRSLLQPFLIFLAIPFSLFGVTLGLRLSDNPFSFFAMLGFFALIGLSIKNTILLTDYANQARGAGMNPVDAAHAALAERFRPLLATSATAVVSLVPLALTSPFWQGLAVVLVFGLLSSTFLVVTVFPYYYLLGEYLRGRWRRILHRSGNYLRAVRS